MAHQRQRLVISEKRCLVINPTLAKQLGKAAALVLQQIHYWSSTHKYGKEIKGQRWIYNSYEGWAEQISIYSVSTIRRAIAKLEEEGILHASYLSEKKSDRTKWYAINYEVLQGCKKDQEESKNQAEQASKMITPSAQNDQIHNKDKTEITSENKQYQKIQNTSEIIKKLFETWNEKVGQGSAITLNAKRAQFLMAAFKTRFGGCFQRWELFCECITTSDFLMGRVKQTFKATLDWVLRFDIIDRILEGDFGIKTVPESNLINQDLKPIKDSLGDQEISLHQGKLLQTFGVRTYLSWFKNVDVMMEEGRAVLKSPSVFWKDYVQTHFGKELSDLGMVCG